MSKKSVKRQALFILFSLSCLAYAGPKKNPEQQQKPQQEKKTQSANQKRRPEKADHQEQSGQNISKGKKRLVGGPVGQLPTQHIDSMQEEKIDPSKQDLNANINANNALNFQQESRSRFGKEEKQNSLQQPECLIQQNTGDRLKKQNFIPVLEQISGMVQEQHLALQNASEIKEQAGERQETAVAQFFKSDYPFRIMASFLPPKTFVNFARTSKTIYKQLLGLDIPSDCSGKARALFVQDGRSFLFDITEKLKKEQIVEFLSDPDKKPLLRRCLRDGKLCITLGDIMIPFLNKNLPHWKQVIVDLRAPIIVLEEMGFDLLKDPRLCSQIIAGEIFGFGSAESVVKKKDLLSLIQQNNILLRLETFPMRGRQEDPTVIVDLFKTKKVVRASLSSALLMKPCLDLNSLNHLSLSIRDLPQFYELAENLVIKAPNLEHLCLNFDVFDPGILNPKDCSALLLKLEKLKNLDLISWQFQSYDEFKAFYRAMPRGLTTIRLSGRRFNCKQLSEFGEYFPALSHLKGRLEVDLQGNISLGQWIKSLEKNQNLVELHLEIDYKELTERKDLALQDKGVLLPHISDFSVSFLGSFRNRSLRNFSKHLSSLQQFSEHMMGVLPLLDMHADAKNQMRDKKRISIFGFDLGDDNDFYAWRSVAASFGYSSDLYFNVFHRQMACLAEMIQNSGSHVEFRFEESTALCLKKSDLLSEQDKKRIVF